MKVPPCRQALVRRHREVLVMSGLVVILTMLLQVRPDGRVNLVGLESYPLPHSCMSYAWFGVKCPGCGLTRSMVYLAQGDWTASWRMHRLGGLMMALILVQFPYRLVALRRGGRPPLGKRLPYLIGQVVIALLVGNWLIGILA